MAIRYDFPPCDSVFIIPSYPIKLYNLDMLLYHTCEGRMTRVLHQQIQRGVQSRRGEGGRLGSNYARICVSKSKGHGSFFSFKGVKLVRIFHSKWV